VTLASVKAAVARLEARGVHPSTRAVRAITGGSQRDAVRFLREVRNGTAPDHRPVTSRTPGAAAPRRPAPTLAPIAVAAPDRQPAHTAALHALCARVQTLHAEVLRIHGEPRSLMPLVRQVTAVLVEVTAVLVDNRRLYNCQ